MNPITNIKNQNKLTTRELDFGIHGGSTKSWHHKYAESAWIYVGGLPYDLNEGDIIAVFSQYGEIVNINLIRDHKTGKSRGFCFLCYQDQRSTILAVDNFNGITLLKRVIRVDHVEEYKVPKYREDIDEEIRKLWEEGCAPKPVNLPDNILEAKEDDEDPMKKMIKKGKLSKDGVMKLTKDLDKEMKKEWKLAKKEAKMLKKEKKKYEKERKRRLEEENAGLAEGNIESSWKTQKLHADSLPSNESDIYGTNDHFNFGKPRKEIPPPPTHNPRPDFEKADWRDIEMWKAVKEREKQEKGEVTSTWKEEECYLPSRFKTS
ncbi:hypothetical protein AB6A40_004393 [Gnathostoma spinigerum]|uniref:RRM domain-containing protein n=1 Tax=Gnathostoma spinigerum TaxID=75299 RepID=A0ABD6ECB9_9BILA